MKKAIIIGAGTYGEVYLEYLSDEYDIIGFIDDNDEIHGNKIKGLPVLGDREYLISDVARDINIFAPIGNNLVRVRILNEMRAAGFPTPSFIHPDVSSRMPSSTVIGNAVYIFPAVNIMPLVTIQDNVMISMAVNLSHHSIIGNGAFLSCGVNLGASINVKPLAYIGSGSTIVTGVKSVGENSLIGAGAVVLKDVPDNAIVAGVPAKVLRYKENNNG